MFIFTGCTGPEKKDQSTEKRTAVIDYRSKGLENLAQSNIMKDILCQTWDYKEDVADTKDAIVSSGIDVVYRGYCFFNDGTLIKDPRGKLKIGRWLLNDQAKPISMIMSFDNAEKEIKRLAHLVPTEMILSTGTENDKAKIALSADAFRHINSMDDPFYTANILWRIKPTSPETDHAIRQRLKDCIHFFVLFYEEKINAEVKTVSFVGLPSCFNWYSGGITLQQENALQQKWVDCFYNNQQAMKAYAFADKLISKKYDWPKKENNWLKLNVAVLRQMENKIDSIH